MKAKIVIFVVLCVLVIVGFIGIKTVFAEDYQESNCQHYTWIDIPGPSGEPAVWITTDPA
jgi:hypothetical protein